VERDRALERLVLPILISAGIEVPLDARGEAVDIWIFRPFNTWGYEHQPGWTFRHTLFVGMFLAITVLVCGVAPFVPGPVAMALAAAILWGPMLWINERDRWRRRRIGYAITADWIVCVDLPRRTVNWTAPRSHARVSQLLWIGRYLPSICLVHDPSPPTGRPEKLPPLRNWFDGHFIEPFCLVRNPARAEPPPPDWKLEFINDYEEILLALQVRPDPSPPPRRETLHRSSPPSD
jgi:hypothetical protein